MRDFTQGSIAKHLVGTAGFIGFGLIVQTLYLLVDVYFVGGLGEHVLAGVAASGSVLFMVLAANQLVSIGTLSLMARALGRGDGDEAQRVFEQALAIAVVAALATLGFGYGIGGRAVTGLAADEATAAAARAYLYAFLPSLALTYPVAAIGSMLRAAGIFGTPMAIQSASVALNVLLAPALIAGWGTGYPLGATGAGLASSIATIAGLLVLLFLVPRFGVPVRLRIAGPDWPVWRRIAAIGWPASAEFLMTFVVAGTIYLCTRPLGADAQAGYRLGARIMQAIFLPALAIAFAIPSIAGRNYGAGRLDRVRLTFATAAGIAAGIMLALTVLCQWGATLLVAPFTAEAAVRIVAAEYLRAVSWNFIGIGVIYCCSTTLQGVGNTLPALYASASRLLTFVGPMFLLSGRAHLALSDIWLLTNLSVAIHFMLILLLLRRELVFRRSAGPPMTRAAASTADV